MSKPELIQVEFERVSRNTRFNPRINITDYGHWIRGELVSIFQGKDLLLFSMNFFQERALRDHPEEYDEAEVRGWATFLLVKKESDYFGKIVESDGVTHDHPEGKEINGFIHIGTTESFPGHKGRGMATFHLNGWMEGGPQNRIAVSIYLRTRFFGGWRDVIVQEPEGEVCIAVPK